MKTAEVIELDGAQAIKLPNDIRFDQRTVLIRRQGKAVILEPVASSTWPPRFFESIRSTILRLCDRIKAKSQSLQRCVEVALAMPYLLDTNTCIAVMRNHPLVVQRLSARSPGDCAISTVTGYELMTGVEGVHSRRGSEQKSGCF